MRARLSIEGRYMEISHEQHMQGCAAFSGAETALLQARITLASVEIELQRAAREAATRGCDNSDLFDAIKSMRALSHDLLARRACIMELHRDFRAIDEEMTPVHKNSDAAAKAFEVSSKFPGKV